IARRFASFAGPCAATFIVNPDGSIALSAASGTCRSSWKRASALLSITVCANMRVANAITIAAIEIQEIVRRDGWTVRTAADSVGQIQPSWERRTEFAKEVDMAYPSLRSLTSGALRALTLMAIHEAARRRLSDAPRMDVVGMRSLGQLVP